ncbi:immunoglobulin i-set domain-containing protein [Ditylenchus destructor]|nr:immunoglobulin i-set domain-containing protein [Ditylenchus destructor]
MYKAFRQDIELMLPCTSFQKVFSKKRCIDRRINTCRYGDSSLCKSDVNDAPKRWTQVSSTTFSHSNLYFVLLLTMSSHFAVCVRNPPASFMDTSMQNVTAMRGDTVEFNCKIQDLGKHMIPPRLLAFDESVFRQPDKYGLKARVNNDEWILVVKDVQESDIGGYTCQLNSNPVITKTGYLSLKIPPTVSRTMTPSAVEVREGHNVTLTCHAEGNPPPTVLWRRQDKQIIRYNGANGYGDTVYRGPELKLSRVSRKHMSEYVCVAGNGIPPDESWSIKLHVLFEPTVVPQAIVAKAETCISDHELSEWSRYATENHVADRYKSVHVLEIKDVQSDQFGRYRCVAANDYGRHFADIHLVEPSYFNADPSVRLLEGSGDPDEEKSPNVDDEDWSGTKKNLGTSIVFVPHSSLTNGNRRRSHHPHRHWGIPQHPVDPETALADYYYDQMRLTEGKHGRDVGDAMADTSSGCSLLRPGARSTLWRCVLEIPPTAILFVVLQFVPSFVLFYYT